MWDEERTPVLESVPITDGQKLVITSNIMQTLIFHINIYFFTTVFKDRSLFITLLFIDEDTKLLKLTKPIHWILVRFNIKF